MAQDDKDQRTEEPTYKRITDAQQKGQVASSQEVKTWIVFVFATGLLIFGATYIGSTISDLLVEYLDGRRGEDPLEYGAL